jgi:hypothetical protein
LWLEPERRLPFSQLAACEIELEGAEAHTGHGGIIGTLTRNSSNPHRSRIARLARISENRMSCNEPKRG